MRTKVITIGLSLFLVAGVIAYITYFYKIELIPKNQKAQTDCVQASLTTEKIIKQDCECPQIATGKQQKIKVAQNPLDNIISAWEITEHEKKVACFPAIDLHTYEPKTGCTKKENRLLIQIKNNTNKDIQAIRLDLGVMDVFQEPVISKTYDIKKIIPAKNSFGQEFAVPAEIFSGNSVRNDFTGNVQLIINKVVFVGGEILDK